MKAYASALVATAVAEIGYHEKYSNSQLESKTANSGSNNWNKYAAYIDKNFPNFYNGPKNGFDWCDIFVDYCMLKTFGLEKTKELTGQPNNSCGAGCPYSYGYYKAKGRVGKTPKVGAQVFFGSSEDGLYHTGIVEKFDSNYVYTIEGNSNEQVARRTYSRSGSSIYGYGYPSYDAETGSSSNNSSNNNSTSSKPASSTTSSSSSGSLNTKAQWTGYIKTTTTPRTWAGTENSALKSVGNLAVNKTVGVCDTVKDSKNGSWYYVVINNKIYGFVPASSVSKTKVSTSSSKPASSTTSSSSSGSLNTKTKWNGIVTADVLNVRTWAGTENPNLKSVPTIKYNTKVGVCDSVKAKDGSTWYYIVINNKTYGFVHSDYIKKI